MRIDRQYVRHGTGIPEVVTQSPFQAVGAFLSIEVPTIAIADHLIRVLDGIINSTYPPVDITYNLFSLHIDQAIAMIKEDEDLSPGTARECTIPTSVFLAITNDWKQYLLTGHPH